jgi:hypothetical protein
VIDKKVTKDMTILMGDLNAKIGADNTDYEDIMGTHGLRQMNENGEPFADLCALNQLMIGGSLFPHKCIHNVIWKSPQTKSQRTRLTAYTSVRSSGDHGGMCKQ